MAPTAQSRAKARSVSVLTRAKAASISRLRSNRQRKGAGASACCSDCCPIHRTRARICSAVRCWPRRSAESPVLSALHHFHVIPSEGCPLPVIPSESASRGTPDPYAPRLSRCSPGKIRCPSARAALAQDDKSRRASTMKREKILHRLMEPRIGWSRHVVGAIQHHHARGAKPSRKRPWIARDHVLVAGRDEHRQ